MANKISSFFRAIFYYCEEAWLWLDQILLQYLDFSDFNWFLLTSKIHGYRWIQRSTNLNHIFVVPVPSYCFWKPFHLMIETFSLFWSHKNVNWGTGTNGFSLLLVCQTTIEGGVCASDRETYCLVEWIYCWFFTKDYGFRTSFTWCTN